MTVSESIRGKTIVLTGAARGVGAAAARLFAQCGANLVLNDNGCEADGSGEDQAPLRELARELRASDGTVEAVFGDVAEPLIAKELAKVALERFQRIDALVSCTGIGVDRAAMRLRESEFEAAFRAQLWAPIRAAEACHAALLDSKGSVLFCASPDAYLGTARRGATAAASAALIAYGRTLAAELRRVDVRVNTLLPTARTRLTESSTLFRSVGEDSMPPRDPANAIVYLVSEEARDYTGEVIGCAGGRTFAIQTRETTGLFVEGGATFEHLAGAFDEVTRP